MVEYYKTYLPKSKKIEFLSCLNLITKNQGTSYSISKMQESDCQSTSENQSSELSDLYVVSLWGEEKGQKLFQFVVYYNPTLEVRIKEPDQDYLIRSLEDLVKKYFVKLYVSYDNGLVTLSY